MEKENIMGNCLTCAYWGGNTSARPGCDFNLFKNATGKCYCKGKNNPHYANGDRLGANDGCEFWEKHPCVLSEREIAEREAQAKEEERKHQEWLASEEGQRWQAEEKKQRELRVAKENKKFLITLLVTGVIGGGIGVLAGGLAGLFIGLFFGIGLGMFWSYIKEYFSFHIRTLPENISEQCASDGIIKGFFFALFMHIILFLIMSIWAFIKSPFVTIYRLVTRDFSFDTI